MSHKTGSSNLKIMYQRPGQTLPKPLVSTNFNGTVALGEKATVFCRSRNDFGGTFYLSIYTSWSYETVKATAA
ncbi:hypothetical protein NXF25_020838 [Crotalus adamanteus]|uniref:Ig-like domain-containing protein n=1 Tax=Crotalus adamanteus TaxID=8729 RepID=A0AAW1B6J8_CROAD